VPLSTNFSRLEKNAASMTLPLEIGRFGRLEYRGLPKISYCENSGRVAGRSD